MEVEARFVQLKELASNVPDFGGRGSPAPRDPKTLTWLARLTALVEDEGEIAEGIALRVAADNLGSALHTTNVTKILNGLYRALARCELDLPASEQGSFIAAGNAYDAIVALGKVLGSATQRVLIVDPYLGEQVLSDYALLLPEEVEVDLLGEEGKIKSNLEPTARAWVTQYGAKRRLRIRLATERSLHDRLILIDSGSVWDISQSLNALASRSPATIAKADSATASLKRAAYEDMFAAGTPLI